MYNRIMKEKECIICREQVFLPVELTCFRCYKSGQISCSSFCRVCRSCAHEYLQLDKSTWSRDFLKRCLFCDARTQMMNLDAMNSYRKDYLLMAEDTYNQHLCPYCHEVRGTQIEIDQHIDRTCPQFYQQCACGTSLRREDFIFHFSSCSQYDKCQVCNEYILQAEIHEHMIKKHDMIQCLLCDQYVPYRTLNVHVLHICPQRLVACDFCHQEIKISMLEIHFQEHDNALRTRVSVLSNQINTVLEEFRLLNRIRSTRTLV